MFILAIVLVLPLASAVSDVAYLYKNDIRVDQNIINEFNSLGLSVDKIQENKISTTAFSEYKMIFVGDELFNNPSRIPIGLKPTIISNYYHGAVFGLTDSDGISQLANNQPLNVNKNGQILQVYTDAFYSAGSSLAIPYYYLSDENKAIGFTKTAGTYTGSSGLDIGDVISYASKGTQLVNGRTLNNKVCFYGLETIKNGKRSSDYWTPAAKQMFEDCAAFVITQCSNDSDCNDNNAHTKDICLNPGKINSQCTYQNITCITDSECNDSNARTVDQCINANTTSSYCRNTEVNCLYNSDCGATGFINSTFCFSDDVYRNFQNATCISPGTLQSHCDIEVNSKLIEQCSDTCSNGQCVDITCYNDGECNDSNAYTKDICLHPGTIQSSCTYQNITCITNVDCNDANAYTQDTCKNPNTPQSYCEYKDIVCITNADCDDSNYLTNDICLNPGTIQSSCNHTLVECVYDADCNDNNTSTIDSCVSNICHHDQIKCFINSDCGANSQTGLFCSNDNVARNSTTYTCLSPGTKNSYCTQNNQTNTIEQCNDICSNGQCVDITCSYDSECNDENGRTIDKCVNPGTSASFCRNTEVNCLNDLDCGITGYIEENFCFSDDVYKKYQNSTCIDPGTLDSYCILSVTPLKTQECSDGNSETYDYCSPVIGDGAICKHDFIQCSKDNDCGTTQLVNEFCKGEDLWGNYSVPVCLDEGSIDSQCSSTNEENFIEECDFGCSNGQCIPPQCTQNSQCGNVSVSNNCIGDDLNVTTTTPLCLSGNCGQNKNSQITICEFGCSNNQCNPPECTQNSQCGSSTEENFCVGNDLHILTTNPICTQGSCGNSTDEEIINCELGCSQGACLEGGHDVALDDSFGNTGIQIRKTSGEVVYGNLMCNEKYKIDVEPRNLGDFYENVTFNGSIDGLNFQHNDILNFAPGASSIKTKIINMTLAQGVYNISVQANINVDDDLDNNKVSRSVSVICEIPECSEDEDCGDIESTITCVGDDVVNITTIPQCISGSCDEDTINNTIEFCELGCYQGECIEGGHDVAIDKNLANSIGGIKLEYPNGTNIPEHEALMCNQNYKVIVNAKNLGDFYENVTFNGSVGGLLFNHNSITNFASGDSSLKTKTLNFSLIEGMYTINISALIPIDDNLSNNNANRHVHVLCPAPPQCTQNSQCGSVNVSNSCIGDDLNVTTTTPLCLSGNCGQNKSSEIIICEFGCSNNQCNPPECTQNSQCGSTIVNHLCVGDDLHNTTISPLCTQGTCGNSSSETIDYCQFGCANGQCIPYNPECGNNILDAGEQCDDGNLVNGDGCSSTCHTETCQDVCQAKPFAFDLQIDRSSSMGLPFGFIGWFLPRPPKILIAQISATNFVEKAFNKNPNTLIGLTTFSNTAANIRGLTNNEQSLKNGIWSIFVFGGTNYYNPIVQGVDKLDTPANTNKTKIIVFLSDGRPNGFDGVIKAIQAANYAKQHNVKIVTVGIGGPINLNEELLKDMSRITGGRYYFASSSIALQGIYNNLAENTCQEICSV